MADDSETSTQVTTSSINDKNNKSTVDDKNFEKKTELKIFIQPSTPVPSINDNDDELVFNKINNLDNIANNEQQQQQQQQQQNNVNNNSKLSTHPNPTLSSISLPSTTAVTSTTHIHTEQPKRRISIASDPVSEGRYHHGGYDNLAFEQNPNRKISQTSLHSHSEIGPVRRKSILVNTIPHDNESIHSHGSTVSYSNHDTTRPNGKAISALDALHARLEDSQHQQHCHRQRSTLSQSYDNNNIEESWIYSLCLRCRVEDNTPSWEPLYWQKVCPYPLCPTFRQFARIISIILIGVLLWIIAYVIIGKSAAPGGQLFGLVVLAVASHIGGWLISLTTLPKLIGMLLVGILFTNLGWVDVSGDFSHITAELRKFALTIILIRAGLEMEPDAFKRVYKTILKLGIVPWTIECCIIAIMSHFLLELPWVWSFLLGSIISAVSPAVVVPCLFRLRSKGYGVTKGIPTLIIAISGIDDALSVAIFGILNSIMFSQSDIAYQISQAPICIIGGLAFGVCWGYMSKYIPEKGDSYVVPLRTIMLFSGGLMAILGSEKIGYEGAGPLGVVFAAFISNYYWCQQGWEIEDNPVSTAFEIVWMIFEPILFGLTGSTIKASELDGDIVTIGIACLVTGILIRILCTAGIAFGDRLNTKEKFFVALACMAKATVQAALGPVALKHLSGDPTSLEYETLKRYGTIVQVVSVLSIILTAPLGAIIITICGPKLLKKTKEPQIVEGWRRSHRPSMRDISIINEEVEEDDIESSKESIPHEKQKKHSFIYS